MEVYRLSNRFPQYERYGLYSQITRAAVSIAANIAEGTQKISKDDKLRFLNISQGNFAECRYDSVKKLGYTSIEDYQKLIFLFDGASFFLNRYFEGIQNNNAIK